MVDWFSYLFKVEIILAGQFQVAGIHILFADKYVETANLLPISCLVLRTAFDI